MTSARRPLLVVALAAAVMALVASAAVAVDVLDRPSSRQSTVRSGASSRSDGLASGSPLVTNGGSINHEMVVLPDDHVVGTRPMGGDAMIDEAGSLE